MKRQKIASLTGVRGVAATLVVLMHFSALFAQLGVFEGIARSSIVRHGYLAVDLFFVLSGFVLAASYADRFVASDNQRTIAQFWIARVFRIMPLNTVCLVLFLAATLAIGPAYWTNERLDAQSFVSALFLVQSWGIGSPTAWNLPAWSLSAEWLAYALFPLIVYLVMLVRTGTKAVVWTVVFLLGLAALMFVLGDNTLDHTWLLGLPRCLLQFTAGMLVWRSLAARSQPLRNPDLLLLSGVSAIATALFVPALELLAPFGFAALVAACSAEGPVTRALLGNRIVEFLGEISFSLYLSHFIVFGFFVKWIQVLDPSVLSVPFRMLFALSAIGVVMIIATLSWWLIEIPGQRIGREVASRLGRSAARDAKVT